ncbi:MAG: hypothetical protein ACFE9L_12430 [Candidatus Hodarchaeota archaeon]
MVFSSKAHLIQLDAIVSDIRYATDIIIDERIPKLRDELDILVEFAKNMEEDTKDLNVLLETIESYLLHITAFLEFLEHKIVPFFATEIPYELSSLEKELKKMTAFIIRCLRPEDYKTPVDLSKIKGRFSKADMDVSSILTPIEENLTKDILTVLSPTKYIEVINMGESFSNNLLPLPFITDSVQQWTNDITLLEGHLIQQITNMKRSLSSIKMNMKKMTAFTIRTHQTEDFRSLPDLPEDSPQAPKDDSLLKSRLDRFKDGDIDTGLSPSPYIYYFPYPKGPPQASAEAIPKRKPRPPPDLPEDSPQAPKDDSLLKSGLNRFKDEDNE